MGIVRETSNSNGASNRNSSFNFGVDGTPADLITMGRLNQLAAFVILTMTIFATPGKGMQLTQCRGVDLDMAEDHVMHINECLKDAGAKEVADIEAQKMACFGKCVFVKKGLIDGSGKPHKEKIMSLITDRMPKEVHDDLNKKVGGCLLPNSSKVVVLAEIIDPKDASCTTYLPLLLCIHAAFLEECAG